MKNPISVLRTARAISPGVMWTLVAITAVAAIVAVATKQYCRVNGWNGADQHLHTCYSDFAQLYGTRGLADRLFPFYTGLPAEQAMEYPALLAVIAGVTAWMIPGSGFSTERQLAYFDLNSLLSFVCWGIVVVLVALMARRPKDALMVAIAPGIILTSQLNWDLWAVLFAIAALWAFSRDRIVWTGVFIGLGTAAKLFPLFLLGAVLVLCWRSGKWRAFWVTTGWTAVTWLVVNVPFMMTAFDEWSRFYTFSGDRDVSFSSTWLIFPALGIDLGGKVFGLLANASFGLLCLAIAYLGLTAKRRPRMAQLAFLIVAAFILTNKVYSPQFVMWLIPLYALATPRWKTFWWWQAAEVYHWGAVWFESAMINAGGYGQLNDTLINVWYATGIAAHVAAVIVICVQIVRDIKDPSRDPVRMDGRDDPQGGPVENAPDAKVWPLTRVG